MTIKNLSQVLGLSERERPWNMRCSWHLRNNYLFILQEKLTVKVRRHKYICPSVLLDYANLKWKLLWQSSFAYLPHCSGTSSLQLCASMYPKGLCLKPRALPIFSLKHPHPAAFPTQTFLQRKLVRDVYTNTINTWKPRDILALCRYKRPAH